MKIKQLLTGILCLVGFCCIAQHDNNWYFGRWAGINFSTGSPIALIDNMQSVVEGTAAISDADGQLLFYTNGIRVYNKNHTLMLNGDGLAGGNSSTQVAVIVPHPGNASRYYIFTTDHQGGANGLTYSEVNMEADAGLGAIEAKNIPLITPICEKISATYHANGTDIWITVHHWGSNAFCSYLVTAAGVSATPVINNAGTVITGASNSGRYAGCMAISPDGSHIAMANVNLGVELFDFNITTGIVSNAVTIRTSTENNGIEFSASGNMLYLSSDNRIYQYQVDASDVAATETEVAIVNENAAMRLGPDSKIYFIRQVLTNFLTVINNPDIAGLGCNIVYDAVDLSGRSAIIGLPTFLKAPFYMLDIVADGNCSDTSITFTATGTQGANSIEWDFGDGSTASALVVTHTYAEAGTYTVKIKAKRGTITRYFSEEIIILESPTATQPSDMIACGDENGQATFDLRPQAPIILGPEQIVDFYVSFHLSETDARQGINPLPDNYTNVSNPQIIYARVSPDAGTCHAITSFALTIMSKPVINLPDSYALCQNQTLTITAPPGFDNYIWDDGTQQINSRSIVVDKAGNYTLTVFKDYGTIVCTAEKIITVNMFTKPQIKEIMINDWTDDNNSIIVYVDGSGDYQYSLNGNIWQDEPVFTHLEPGRYTVYVKDKNGCGETSGTAVLLMYPRFFTPNGDGENEIWHVKYAYFEPDMVTNILDRYGKLLYSFKGNSGGWDGTFNGNRLPATDYWFVITRSNGKEYKGHFSMIR